MGTPSLTMKFLVVLALSGLAMAEPEAEADPALLYGQYGYGGLGYPTAYGYGLRRAYAAWNPYRALHYRRHYYGKREAESEPKAEADPQMLLNGFQQAFPAAQQTIVHQANPIQTIQKTFVQQAAPIQTVQTKTFHQQQPITQTWETKTFHQQPIHTQTAQQTFQQQPVQTVLRDAIVQEATPVQAVFNPVQNLQTPPVQAFPSQSPFTNTHIIAKREAEAEADPALLIHTNNGLNAPLVYSNAAIPQAPQVYTTAFAQPSTLVQSVQAVQSPLIQAVQSPLLQTVIPSVQAGVYQAGPNCVDQMGFAIPC